MEKEQMKFKKKQKNEAIERLKKLELHSFIIDEFIENNKIYLSEKIVCTDMELLFFSDLESELKKKIKDFELKYNALVYHVILSHTSLGDMYSFMYVSQNEEEWGIDMDDLQENLCFVYVWNKTYEDCSEFGTIKINMKGKYIERVL